MCAAWKKKNERNEIVCFCCTQSGILLCGIARFSWENKNELRTFQSQKWKKLRAASLKQNLLVLINKRVYFEEHLWMSASKPYLKRDYNPGVFLWTLLFKNTYFAVDLQMASSEKPLRGSLFNKVASVMAWTHLTVLEKNPSKGIYLRILWNLKEAFLQNTC